MGGRPGGASTYRYWVKGLGSRVCTGVVSRALGPVLGATGAITASDLNGAMLGEVERLGVEGASIYSRC
ncbi:MAG: hypothetical protein ACKVIQ_01335 [Acidimicrobiales bacterium]